MTYADTLSPDESQPHTTAAVGVWIASRCRVGGLGGVGVTNRAVSSNSLTNPAVHRMSGVANTSASVNAMRRSTRTRLTVAAAVCLAIAVALSLTTVSGWWATAFGALGLALASAVLLTRRFARAERRDVA